MHLSSTSTDQVRVSYKSGHCDLLYGQNQVKPLFCISSQTNQDFSFKFDIQVALTNLFNINNGFCTNLKFGFFKNFYAFVHYNLNFRLFDAMSGLFFNTLCRIDLKLGTCIYLVLLQIKFAFRKNRITVTYFMAETRSSLCFAFLGEVFLNLLNAQPFSVHEDY